MKTITFNASLALTLGVYPAVILAELQDVGGSRFKELEENLPFFRRSTIRKYLHILEGEKLVYARRGLGPIYYEVNLDKLRI